MVRLSFLAILLSGLGIGCSGTQSASVTPQEEEMFKHPAKVDMSKIPANAFKTKGPMFVGKPTGATHPSGAPTPPAAGTTGG